MKRLVQKFGGTSLRDAQHIRRVAKIVADTHKLGKQLVVVVSAMGDTTDELIRLAGEVSSDADARELDVLLATGEQVSIAMLSLALQSLGLKARSFTGPQAGILTDDTHGFARIKTVQASRLETSLQRGEVAVVAGFQGMTRTSELTTLGRGGSDTTAVALAAALKAECCDIYTDVDGIYTTDPRTVGQARKLRIVSYEEMLALASAGAQVLNARSVELAMKNRVPVRLRSTFDPQDSGTLVTSRDLAPEYTVCGVACDSNSVSMRLALAQDFSGKGEQNDVERSAKIEQLIDKLEDMGIAPQHILKKKADGNSISEIEFTCETRLSKTAQSVLKQALNDFPASSMLVNTELARISIVGGGVHADQNMENDLLNILNEAEIPVSMLTSDELSISALIPQNFRDDAVRHVHAKFCQEASRKHTPANI